jgi:hypothetical protein
MIKKIGAGFGHGKFDHAFSFDSILEFHDARRWMVQTYGLGTDVKNAEINADTAPWGYYIVYQSYIIYLRGEEELSWFYMKYGEQLI